MELTFRFVVVAAFLWGFCHGVEISEQHLAMANDDVTFVWNSRIQALYQVIHGSNTKLLSVTFSNAVSIAQTLKEKVFASLSPDMMSLNITVMNVNRSDAGVYTLYDDMNNALLKQLLIIQAKPDKPTITLSPGAFVVGREKTLTCVTKSNSYPLNHSLPLTFHWTALPAPPGGRQEGNTYVFTAKSQDRRKTFNFSCQAEEGELLSDVSRERLLTPEYGPLDVALTSLPATVERKISVREGEPLTLTCSADCKPRCRIAWKDRNSVELQVGMANVTYSTTAGRSHFGNFSCSMENAHGSKTRRRTIDVLYDANITEVNVFGKSRRDGERVVVTENSSVDFSLMVDSNPQPRVSYYSKNWSSVAGSRWGSPTSIGLQGPKEQALDSGLLHLYQGGWSIPRAQCSDTKDFLVEAKGPQQNRGVTIHINLSVNCVPRPTDPPTQKFGVGLNSSQTVEFSITAFPRDLDFRLLLNNSLVSPQPRLRNSPLPEPWKMKVAFDVAIRKMTDYGMYQARFGNTVGGLNISFSIFAQGKPQSPSSPGSEHITPSAVTLNWSPGFDGGLQQTFSVEYRPHGAESWTPFRSGIEGTFITVNSLQPGTTYHFRVFGVNELGLSAAAEVEVTTLESPGVASTGLIVGIVAIIVIIAVIVGVIVFIKRRRQSKQDKDKEVNVHLMDNAGVSQPTPAEEAVYSCVVKKLKPPAQDDTGTSQSDSQNKCRGKKPSETVYENVDTLGVGLSSKAQNGSAASSNNDKPSRRVNDDGLVYVDVEIGSAMGSRPRIQPQNNNEAETEYVTIDFSKQAPIIAEVPDEEEK